MTTEHPFLVADLRAKAEGIAANLNTERLTTRPLLTIDYATELLAVAEAIRAEAVAQAREAGESWQTIGAQMGMSKQAAHLRYA